MMYDTFRRRQLAICSQLESAGLSIRHMPNGAMYFFADISQFSSDSESFSMHLLNYSGIATVPGVYFGSNGESHLRFSCAGSDEDISDLGALFYDAANSYPGH